MSDLVGNPEDRFSRVEALVLPLVHIWGFEKKIYYRLLVPLCKAGRNPIKCKNYLNMPVTVDWDVRQQILQTFSGFFQRALVEMV